MQPHAPVRPLFCHLVAVWSLCSVVGCQAATPPRPAAAAADDAPHEQLADAEDSAADVTPEAAPDSAPDSAPELDSPADAPLETASDTAADLFASDAGADAAPTDATGTDTATIADAVALDTAATKDANQPVDTEQDSDVTLADTATSDALSAVLQISDVMVQPAPNNPLACRVTWNSSEPASSVVLFGLSAPTMRMRDPTLALSHEVLVLGMRADQSYTLQVRSQTAKGTVVTVDAPPFQTGKLPPYLSPATVTKPWVDLLTPHFIVLAAIHLNLPFAYNPYDFTPTAVMYDDEGQVVWFHSQANGTNILAWLSDTDHTLLVAGGGPPLVMNLAGDQLWQGNGMANETGGPPQPATGMLHGDLRQLPNGNFLGIEYDVRKGVWGDQLVERTPDGQLLWLWSSFDYLAPGAGDWAHGNSLQPLDNGATVLYSPRNLNMIFKIDRLTNKFVLRLGDGGDFALDPASSDDWFALQHSAEALPGNRILLYDNGTMTRGYSRAVEYEYDVASKKAKIVWQYLGAPGPKFFSPGQGSVQRLANGDTLISAPDWKAGFAMPSSLRRVNASGELKWRLNLPVIYDYPTVAYRAQQVALPGLEFVAPGEAP